jgi:hypothetical protein
MYIKTGGYSDEKNDKGRLLSEQAQLLSSAVSSGACYQIPQSGSDRARQRTYLHNNTKYLTGKRNQYH